MANQKKELFQTSRVREKSDENGQHLYHRSSSFILDSFFLSPHVPTLHKHGEVGSCILTIFGRVFEQSTLALRAVVL